MLVSPPKTISSGSKRQGFTLIELLMVIAVILILAGITFGITRGVQNAQARAKAKAELAVISQALEQFKSRYGDYPWISVADVSVKDTDDPQIKDAAHGAMKTLVGWQSVTGTQVGDEDAVTEVEFKKATSTLDVSKLSLSGDWPSSTTEVSPQQSIYFQDPWGNAYVYMYKNPSEPRDSQSWERFGYILFSRGPDGAASSAGIDESTGEIVTNPVGSSFRNQSANIDNIMAGE